MGSQATCQMGSEARLLKMAIIYDEVWITSSREVKICLDAIKAYEKELKKLEEKGGINGKELLLKIEKGYVPGGHEVRWYETYLGLMRTRDRLDELKRFLE